MIHIVGPKYKVPDDAVLINTTSRSKDWSKGLSPFFAGPVDLCKGYISINVENAWQFCKVYYNHVDDKNEPTKVYFDWAEKGWKSVKAYRYPMGKGVKPLYSYWDGQHLTYVEARKKIYIPLYSQAVQKTYAFGKLKKMHEEGQNLYLWDFDGYDHKALGCSYDEVINNPERKMGHAFVIGMLLEGHLK